MARREVFTNSLANGEIAPEYLSRSDMASRSEAAKTMVNVAILSGGGVRRRAGTRDLIGLSGDARLFTIGIGAGAQIVMFLAGAIRFLDQDGSLIQAVTGGPWLASDLHTMQVALEDGKIVITSVNFPPQIVVRTNGVWALSAFTFLAGVGGSVKRPYYRFPGYLGVSIQPSALTGVGMQLNASASLFEPAHVGSRFRYNGVEMLVTLYNNPTQVIVTIEGKLYPTTLVSVIDSSPFVVGQEVAGLDSNTKGVVIEVPGPTSVRIQLTGGYTAFDWTSSTVNEKIVSPTGVSAQGITAPFLELVPSPTVIWDEQLISPVRGYPGSCGLHRTRLLLGNFPSAVSLIAASALGDITDFDVGTGLDSDAIVELIGLDGSIGVRHFGSTEQLLFFTQSGAQYVPEQVGAPLSPTNFDVLKIGPESAAPPTPILVAEGMLFVEERSGRVMGAIPTGNVRRSWQIDDLSELAFHMMGTPTELCLLAARTNTDRKVILVKDDGALAVMAYRRSDTTSGWARWETAGQWRSTVAANGMLYLVALRTIGGVPTYRLEVLDDTIYGDGIVSIPTLATAIPQYANQTVSVWSGPSYLGDFKIGPDGVLVGVPDAYSSVDVGFDTQITLELVPPIDGTDGLRHKLRICRVDLEAISSGAMRVNGYDPSGFVTGAGVGGAVSLVSGTRRFRILGRSETATAIITQDHAAPFEVRSVTMEVTS